MTPPLFDAFAKRFEAERVCYADELNILVDDFNKKMSGVFSIEVVGCENRNSDFYLQFEPAIGGSDAMRTQNNFLKLTANAHIQFKSEAVFDAQLSNASGHNENIEPMSFDDQGIDQLEDILSQFLDNYARSLPEQWQDYIFQHICKLEKLEQDNGAAPE